MPASDEVEEDDREKRNFQNQVGWISQLRSEYPVSEQVLTVDASMIAYYQTPVTCQFFPFIPSSHRSIIVVFLPLVHPCIEALGRQLGWCWQGQMSCSLYVAGL